MILSQGTLLDGRVTYAQPVEGYRTGIEPVLLAACIPARPGERVLEAGTGAGAGLLCLLARVPGVDGVGLEIDPAMAAVARANLGSNGRRAPVHAVSVAEAGRFGPVDHAFANPPWHDPAGTRSPDPGRALAKHLPESGLATWVNGLAAAIASGGSLSLALPAALMGEALAVLRGEGFGRASVLPLWPRAGAAAKLILVQARRGSSPSRLGPGLVLHGPGPGYTTEAEAVLRGGAALAV